MTLELFRPDVQDRGLAGENGRYFKLNSRYYYAKTFQYEPKTPDDSLGLMVFDR